MLCYIGREAIHFTSELIQERFNGKSVVQNNSLYELTFNWLLNDTVTYSAYMHMFYLVKYTPFSERKFLSTTKTENICLVLTSMHESVRRKFWRFPWHICVLFITIKHKIGDVCVITAYFLLTIKFNSNVSTFCSWG